MSFLEAMAEMIGGEMGSEICSVGGERGPEETRWGDGLRSGVGLRS